MNYKGYHARVSFEEDDDVFVGRLAGIADVVGFHADSVAALKAAFHEAVDDYVATCAKIGKDPLKPASGRLMFRVDPTLHARALIAAEVAGKSLNQWAEDALRSAADANLKVLPETADAPVKPAG